MLHVRHQFDEELELMSRDLVRMGSMAEHAIAQAVEVLASGDPELARRIIRDDADINALERDIEQRCLHLLLRQQPVAGDLRRISAAMKMVTDIERIGDGASDIAEITLSMPPCDFPEIRQQMAAMAETARSMIRDSIDAYVKEDMDLAERTIARDDLVDEQFTAIRTALAHRLIHNSDEMDAIIDHLMIIKYLERAGDHAVNICEWVQFYKTGIFSQK